MLEEKIIQELRLKNKYETRNYFFEQIEQKKLVSRKQKMVSITLNCIEHILILTSTITGFLLLLSFVLLKNYEFSNRIKCLYNNSRN